MNKSLHLTLLENEVFRQLYEELKKQRPIVAHYELIGDNDNSKQVLASILIQQGYDRAIQLINPFTGEQK